MHKYLQCSVLQLYRGVTLLKRDGDQPDVRATRILAFDLIDLLRLRDRLPPHFYERFGL
jgi:hypothetical protein